MGSKLFTRKKHTIFLTWDYDVHGGAVGTIKLGDLPDNFVVTEMVAVAESAPIGGGSMVVGEDGGGDADGYFLDLDGITVGTPVKGGGALLLQAPATANEIGNEKPHQVAAAKDGFQITIASTVYTAGKIHFAIDGYQVY